MKGRRLFIISTICIYVCLMGSLFTGRAQGTERTVLATTFPIYQIVRNVVRGHEGVKVDLMLPSNLGCPHDYALTPQDMRKLARADILVVNGLGMEEFLGAPVEKANPRITVIDSSAGIKETLRYSEGHDHDHGHKHGHDGHGHHHHAGVNPHLFVSPRMTARLALNIAAGLSKADPKGSEVYLRNAGAYSDDMNKLADEMAALGARLKNNRIVEPHGVFDYLARDMGVEIVAVMQAHGREPSAAEMMELVKLIKEKRVGAIFTEPQYPEKVGKSLSQQTGAPAAMVDPVAAGPEDAPLNYFETVMRRNMEIIRSIPGVK